MPAFTPRSVILYVSDVGASTEFYRTILGADPLETFTGFAVFALSATMTLGLQAADLIEPPAEPHVGGTELPFGYTFVATDPDGHRLRVCATDTIELG